VANRYFIHLAYKGSQFHGWQIQENAPTIQQFINEGLNTLLQTEINVTGCGRTDTGVHAHNFYAHFDINKELSAADRAKITFKLNRFLPKEISIFEIKPVKERSHARFDAIARTYKYFIIRRKDPFLDDFAYYLYGDLDVDLMNKAAIEMMTYSDFTSFSKLHSQTKTNDCKISEAHWTLDGHQLIFTIKADRFLRNMVRAIVGTLIEVGQHKVSIEEFKQIIELKNRSEAGYSVPSKALFLEEIEYPEDLYKF
jgi:tRNA pseudouridine38-40 synthase